MRAISSMLTRASRTVVALGLAAGAAGAAGAQMPNASPKAFGMAGNFTAVARGYEAVAWNPANLAQYGRPFLSIGFMPFGGTVGMDPVGFNNLGAFGGQVVDSATRAAWVELVKAAGRQRVRVDGGVTPFAMSLGPFGFQVGTSLYTNLDFGPGMWEALLFGNAGNHDGQAGDLDFTGTGVSTAAFTTGAASFAMAVPFKFTAGMLPNERLTVGVTAKYVLAHGMVNAIADSGGTSSGGISLSMPAVFPDSNYEALTGAGVGTGADLSMAWSAGPWRVGVLAENVFNSFKWDTTRLAYAQQSFYFDQDTSYSTGDELPYGSAPLALRDQIRRQGFKPAINIGASFRISSNITLTADMHQQMGGDDAISIGPKSRMGVGGEFRYVPFVPIRAGVASVTDGWQAAAGFGVRLLGYEIGVSGSIRRRGSANESGMMIGIVGIGH